MKIRKTTKVFIVFAVLVVASYFVAEKMAIAESKKAAQRAEKAGRPLAKPNGLMNLMGTDYANIDIEEVDSVYVDAAGDTIRVHTTKTTLDR